MSVGDSESVYISVCVFNADNHVRLEVGSKLMALLIRLNESELKLRENKPRSYGAHTFDKHR